MDPISAANAYNSRMNMQTGIGDAGGAPEQSDKSSFSNLLKEGLQSAIDTQYKAESLKMDAVTGGKVDVTDLVTAISSAELSLNTVIAIRDKVIGAYQDIIRMPM